MSATTFSPTAALPAQDKLTGYGALALRVASGGLFLAHGLIKFFLFTPAGTAAFFEKIGLPGPLAYLIIAMEVFGGLAMILGLFTRWVSLALVPVLLGALISAHLHTGFTFSNPGGGWEFPAFWTVTLLVQSLLGNGAFSVHRK